MFQANGGCLLWPWVGYPGGRVVWCEELHSSRLVPRLELRLRFGAAWTPLCCTSVVFGVPGCAALLPPAFWACLHALFFGLDYSPQPFLCRCLPIWCLGRGSQPGLNSSQGFEPPVPAWKHVMCACLPAVQAASVQDMGCVVADVMLLASSAALLPPGWPARSNVSQEVRPMSGFCLVPVVCFVVHASCLHVSGHGRLCLGWEFCLSAVCVGNLAPRRWSVRVKAP
jgi:hypothetical protein